MVHCTGSQHSGNKRVFHALSLLCLREYENCALTLMGIVLNLQCAGSLISVSEKSGVFPSEHASVRAGVYHAICSVALW